MGILFIPAVTNNKSVVKNNSSVLMNNMPLLMNNMPLLMNNMPLLMNNMPLLMNNMLLLQDLTSKSGKVPVQRRFKRSERLQEVTSDLTKT